jgi:LuxR family maltose regulon positive regulatory protein
MPAALLFSKLYIPPARPDIVLRPRLIERLSGSLCDAVTAQDGGRGMLETLERGNLHQRASAWYERNGYPSDAIRRAEELELF